ncbi:hypothetical protein FVE85_7838 [Porphyridium purpureum]|uniref:Uncharacterized protein n=1 Tax=Porphyridium purpureum TaxID=35688 RepID=A0A5J4YJD3_PORPP|nr:hypothetical protein FVE85_7838 [Porphyridium purpureum]|eukprot:POR3608..scf271_22
MRCDDLVLQESIDVVAVSVLTAALNALTTEHQDVVARICRTSSKIVSRRTGARLMSRAQEIHWIRSYFGLLTVAKITGCVPEGVLQSALRQIGNTSASCLATGVRKHEHGAVCYYPQALTLYFAKGVYLHAIKVLSISLPRPTL